MEPVVLRKPLEVVNALDELELAWEPLRDAMVNGERGRDACTPNDPQSAPGYFSYALTTRRLAELLIPSGWTRVDVDGLALVVSPLRQVAIAVSTGDGGTGVYHRSVRSKYPKGPAMKMAVEQNRQGELFPKTTPSDSRPAGWKTWLLLRRRADDKLYCELSLPYEIGEDDHVVEWSRRIVFEPFSFSPTIEDDENGGSPIDIDIRPRS